MAIKFDFDAAISHLQKEMPEGCSMEIDIDKGRALVHIWGPDGEPVSKVEEANIANCLQLIATLKVERVKFDQRMKPKKKVEQK